jgi:dipeptidase
MHAGGWMAASQSVASMVSELSPEGQQHWATGTSAPCFSVFRPIALDFLPVTGKPTGASEEDSLWWRFEGLHRRLLRADRQFLVDFHRERNLVQGRMFEESSADAWQIADDWLSRWRGGIDGRDGPDRRPSWLRAYWRRIAIQAETGSLMPWRDA